jgi:uncharacterized repeat protein (TIGR03803 family)
MRATKLFNLVSATTLVLPLVILNAGKQASAQQVIAVHNFGHNIGALIDGARPYASVVFDATGNLYGTTFHAGAYHAGTVYELSPQPGGGWTEKVLHSFQINRSDGMNPFSKLVLDTSGNLYGTTALGGTYDGGTVFELTHTAAGGWMEKILHSFQNNGEDGLNPHSGLIVDAAGNLYGTTPQGGAYGGGTVFELSPGVGGSWSENVLYHFNISGSDAFLPYASLILDAAGNLYGTTEGGGTFNAGTVFELSPSTSGLWNEEILYNFSEYGSSGYSPVAGLILDAKGNLYGTSGAGGAFRGGVVFELTPVDGTWDITVLVSLANNTEPPVGPNLYAGLVLDTAGNLYGATTFGGNFYADGSVFELEPLSHGNWLYKELYSSGTYGANPYDTPILDTAGNLYITASEGGKYTAGTVFEITP